MATQRNRTAMKEKVGVTSQRHSGTDSADESGEGQTLTEEQWTILDRLERVGERLPSRASDGSLPAWGGMDFRDMTPEQQTVYLVGSLTKVAGEGALVLESEGSDYEQTLTSFSDLLHDLDRGVHVPLDLKDQREQELMDRCYHLSEEAKGTRREIMMAAENNISALAVELQTTK